MEFKVELTDFFDRIEGEEIQGYHAYVVDENNQRWRYGYHRQPRQSIEAFLQEVCDAFHDHREEDFRVVSEG
ncbi:hypothetical protein [Ammoniphilus sp. CFH 90114]|uniref:hypothetical protein n=1 Tax=Ammoniphilus sp. CFH 90114 TaxID=2493665 RepID=UPI00100E0D96|nr:hypothetical protein [Ammoniphilus sp. CFH 90114]RXT08823.1 hypothetical protein EIZ39_08465 [Ammoniphilus sp. CFH 90114]